MHPHAKVKAGKEWRHGLNSVPKGGVVYLTEIDDILVVVPQPILAADVIMGVDKAVGDARGTEVASPI